MNNQLLRRLIAPAMLGLLMCGLTAAQQTSSKSFPPGPCHQNTKACVQRMNSQLGVMRAYAKRLKPGDNVSFNPQPDPPGSPDPWYRRANEAFQSLQGELADLSTWSEENANERNVRGAVGETQSKLNKLSQPSSPASLSFGLKELSASVQRLAKVLTAPH